MRVKAYQYQELTTKLIQTLTKTGHNAVSWSYNCLASSMQHAWKVTCKQLQPIPKKQQSDLPGQSPVILGIFNLSCLTRISQVDLGIAIGKDKHRSTWQL